MFSHKQQIQIELLEEVLKYVESSTHFNFICSGWETVEEAMIVLLSYIERIKKNDTTVYENISLIFAPTGILQDISIDNGWSEKYLELASKSDRIFS